MYPVALRFGAFLVTLPESNVASASFEEIMTVAIVLVYGALGAGEAGAFAPNYAKAKLSARKIFNLLDRETAVDSHSKDGIVLVYTVTIALHMKPTAWLGPREGCNNTYNHAVGPPSQ